MWKLREMEKQSTADSFKRKRREQSPDLSRWGHSGYMELYPEEFETDRSRMRCDGFDEADRRVERSHSQARLTSEQDIREARYCTKKLYKFEANDPDRWGHSGYKELYPEEFETDGEEQGSDKDTTVNGKKGSRHKKLDQGSRKRKRSKQSHKKKKKKRSHKKVKRKKREQSTDSSSDGTSSDEKTHERKKMKRKRKKKSAKKMRKTPSSSSVEGSDWTGVSDSEVSSSDESEAEVRREKWSRKRKKKSRHSRTLNETEIVERKSKRKNWKVANDDRSESSEED